MLGNNQHKGHRHEDTSRLMLRISRENHRRLVRYAEEQRRSTGAPLDHILTTFFANMNTREAVSSSHEEDAILAEMVRRH
jgi:hypothetical protein